MPVPDGPKIIYIHQNILFGTENYGEPPQLAATPFAVYFDGNVGTVNTSGTAVTWVSGTTFTPGMTTIWIAGVQYSIASVNSSTSITLTTSAGTQTGSNYGNSGFASGFSGYIGQIKVERDMEPFNACTNATNPPSPVPIQPINLAY